MKMAVKHSDIQIGDFVLVYPNDLLRVERFCECGCKGVIVEGGFAYFPSHIMSVLPVRDMVLPDLEWV